MALVRGSGGGGRWCGTMGDFGTVRDGDGEWGGHKYLLTKYQYQKFIIFMEYSMDVGWGLPTSVK